MAEEVTTCDELLDLCAEVVQKQSEAIEAQKAVIEQADEVIEAQTEQVEHEKTAKKTWTIISIVEGALLLLLNVPSL